MRPPQLPRRSALLCALLLCASCIFTESAINPNTTPRDNLDMPQTADSGAGGEDLAAPDLASPPDAGMPDAGVPDAGVPDSGVPDSGVPDMDVPEDMGCVAETDRELCEGFLLMCGPLTITRDSCGVRRAIDCGTCERGTCTDGGKCVCTREDDGTLCVNEGVLCGGLVTTDSCGDERVISSCGTCDTSKSEVCEAGKCECKAPADQALCGIAGRQCGILKTVDICGADRTVDCGSCSMGTCDDASGVCSICQPEAPSAFCARLGKQCGPVTAPNNCGDSRTVDCGSCSNGRVCNANSNQCECPAPVCPNNAQCGGVSNACGRSTMCGAGCPAGSTCAGFMCQCIPETNKQFCDRAPAAQCGTKSGFDNCGVMRAVDCGDCNGNAGRCSNNQCTGCISPDPQQFCSDLGVMCGAAQGFDPCTGAPRCVQDCGSCGAGSQCCAGRCDPSSGSDVCIFPDILCGGIMGPK